MSTKTEIFGLNKTELTDTSDIRNVNNSNMDVIDKGLVLKVGYANSTNNVYTIYSSEVTNLYEANRGATFTFFADKDSTGEVSVVLNNGTAYQVLNSHKNRVKNLKQGVPYTIIWDGYGYFFLASGGVDDVNFSASDLLENKSANNSDGEKVNGTMKNVGQQTATINAGGKVVITKGYHDGTGYIQSNSMSTQLNSLGVTLTGANQLINGIKAVDKTGKLITGTATIQSLGGLVKQEGTFVRRNSENTVTLGYRPKMVICMLADSNQDFLFDLGQELYSFIPTRIRLIQTPDRRDCYYYWDWTDSNFYGHYGIRITDNGFTHFPSGGMGQSVSYIAFR